LNRLDQQMSQFQAQVQASFAQQRDRVDHKFRSINNNIRCFGCVIEGDAHMFCWHHRWQSFDTADKYNGRRLRRPGEGLPGAVNRAAQHDAVVT
jgi:hypothetical protein